MDPLSLAVGAGLLILGMIIGRVQRTPKVPPKEPPPVPLCSCEHYLSSHDPETGMCGDVDDAWRFEVTVGRDVKYTQPCRCLQYVGPRPLDVMYSTPMID